MDAAGERRADPMRIVHVGGHASPNIVDGINAVVWTIAVEQLKLGHETGLLLSEPPDDEALALADRTGLELLYVPASTWRYDDSIGKALIQRTPADIVHFHSVFVPRQATLARQLRRWAIPYVITPHGGLMPQVLSRGRLKKQVYSTLIEKPRFRHAAGIAYITPGGERDIRAYVRGFRGPVRWVPNPVDIDGLQQRYWQPRPGRPYFLFLGRFDVYHKGLDRLAEIARRVPEADFILHGVEDPGTLAHLNVIRAYAPANLAINPPIFGDAKLELLSGATMYIQVSRWEALSISILEALALGTPTVIAESMSMAGMFRENDLGLVVSTRPDEAARQIRQALVDEARLRQWSQHSRAYARARFSPASVARSVVGVYEEALDFWADQRGVPALLPRVEPDIWREVALRIKREEEAERRANEGDEPLALGGPHPHEGFGMLGEIAK